MSVMGTVNHGIPKSPTPLLPAWPDYLLQSIVHNPRAIPAPAKPDSWETLFADAQTHQLAPLLYWALQKSLVEQQPPAVLMQQMRHYYRTTSLQALQQKYELRTILTALNDDGIRPTLYKGAALSHTVYPTPACRPMGDLDLWVSAEEMPLAQAVIEKLGYHKKIRQDRPTALQSKQEGEVQLIGQQPGKGVIELHWGVFPGQWLHCVTTVDRIGIRQRRVMTELLGASVFLLANEDAIIQLAAHLAISHQLSHYPLRSLFDIALLDQQQVDWAVIVERAAAWRLTTVMSVMLDLLITIFGTATLTPGAVRAAATLRAREWRPHTQRWRNPSYLFSKTKISSNRSRFFYLLSMIDRPQDVVYLLSRTLWPENEWLAARYGNVNYAVRLRHLKSTLQGTI